MDNISTEGLLGKHNYMNCPHVLWLARRNHRTKVSFYAHGDGLLYRKKIKNKRCEKERCVRQNAGETGDKLLVVFTQWCHMDHN